MRGKYYLLRKPSKEFILSELKRKELIFQFADDSQSSADNIGTYINFFYQSIWKKRYGMKRVKFLNENINEVETIEPLFAPTPIRLSTGDLKYPTSAIRCYPISGETAPSPENKLRILFSNSVDRPITVGYNIINGGSTQFITPALFQTATHYDNPLEPSVDLNYGISNQYFYYPPDREYTENNLFNTFWSRTIVDINKQKLIEVNLFMSEEAISTLAMNTIFFLEINEVSNYYIINKIREWNIETGEAILELITWDLQGNVSGRVERIDEFQLESGFIGGILPNKPIGVEWIDYYGGTIRPDRGIEFGGFNNTDGKGTIISGRDNTVSGDDFTIRGDGNSVQGSSADIKGNGNYFSGIGGNIGGSFNEIIGNWNEVIGDKNEVNGNANEVRGNENDVVGDRITVKGSGIVASTSDWTYYQNYIVDNEGNSINPMSIRIDTQLTGSSGSDQFSISTDSPLLIRWGDGTETLTTSFSLNTHTYPSSGIWNIEITGATNRLIFNASGDQQKVIGVFNIGDLSIIEAVEMFAGCVNLSRFVVRDGRFLNNNTSLNETFTDIVNLPTLDLTSFDVGNLQTMEETFRGGGFEVIDMTGWDTTNLTTMIGTFQNCNNLVEIRGFADFNIGNITDMTDLMDGITLPTDAYETIWAGWTGSTPQTGVTFSGGGATLSVGSPGDLVRTDFITNYSWVVTDGDNP